MHRTLKYLVAVLLVFEAGRAGAEEPQFGDVRHVAISAERLFGFVHTSETQSPGGVDMTRSQDSVSIFSNPLGGASGYSWPRIALDVFVAQSVSVGGAAGFFDISPPSGSISGFLFAPRAGYVAHLGPKVVIWPRGGITYEHVSNSGGAATATVSAFALTLEAPLAILVVPRVAILVGPALDLGLSGTRSVGAISVDDKFTDFGIESGLLVYF